MTEEKLTDVINDFFGVDAMYYGVDSYALSKHIFEKCGFVQIPLVEFKFDRTKQIFDLKEKVEAVSGEVKHYLNFIDSELHRVFNNGEVAEEDKAYESELCDLSMLLHMAGMNIKGAEQILNNAIYRSEGIKIDISLRTVGGADE